MVLTTYQEQPSYKIRKRSPTRARSLQYAQF